MQFLNLCVNNKICFTLCSKNQQHLDVIVKSIMA